MPEAKMSFVQMAEEWKAKAKVPPPPKITAKSASIAGEAMVASATEASAPLLQAPTLFGQPNILAGGALLARGSVGTLKNAGDALAMGSHVAGKLPLNMVLPGASGVNDAIGTYGQALSNASETAMNTMPVPRPTTYPGQMVAGAIEAVPNFAMQVGAGVLAAPAGIPAAIAAFSTTAAAPVVGQQYADSVRHWRTQGVDIEEAKNKASIEATAAGIATIATNAIPLGILSKIPGIAGLIGKASQIAAARFVGAGAGEGLQEVSESVVRDALIGAYRGEDLNNTPSLATIGSTLGGMYATGNPAFNTLTDKERQWLKDRGMDFGGGFLLGGTAAATIHSPAAVQTPGTSGSPASGGTIGRPENDLPASETVTPGQNGPETATETVKAPEAPRIASAASEPATTPEPKGKPGTQHGAFSVAELGTEAGVDRLIAERGDVAAEIAKASTPSRKVVAEAVGRGVQTTNKFRTKLARDIKARLAAAPKPVVESTPTAPKDSAPAVDNISAEKEVHRKSTIDEFNRVGKATKTVVVEPQTAQEKAIAKAGAKAGIDVVFVDSDSRLAAYHLKPGVVVVKRGGGKNAAVGYYFHEALHDLKVRDPEGWRRVQAFVRRKAPAAMRARARAYLEATSLVLGPEEGAKLAADQDRVDNESVSNIANAIEDVLAVGLSDRAALTKMAQSNPGVMRRIAALLRRIVDAVRGRKRNQSEIDPKTAAQIASVIIDSIGEMSVGSIDSAKANEIGSASLIAYHGTPHRFDRFTTEKIGTGEGAQSYGWGLYFSSSKEVAKWYRKWLTEGGNGTIKVNGLDPIDWFRGHDAFRKIEADYEAALAAHGSKTPKKSADKLVWDVAFENIRRIGQMLADGHAQITIARKLDGFIAENTGFLRNAKTRTGDNPAAAPYYDAQISVLKTMRDAIPLVTSDQPGTLYRVDIKPDKAHLLDQDARLEDQPEHVKNALLQNAIIDNESGRLAFYSLDGMVDNPYGSAIYRGIQQMIAEDYGPDALLEFAKNYERADQAASMYLNSIGIPGMSYTGQSSGETNYVIFNDEAVDVAGRSDQGSAAVDVQRVLDLFKTAKSEKEGEFKVGTPDLALQTGTRPERDLQRAVQTLHIENLKNAPREDQVVMAEAAVRIQDLDGEARNLLAMVAEGRQPLDVDIEVFKNVVANAVSRAVSTMSEADIARSAELQLAWSALGTEQARALRMRRDKYLNPQQRVLQFLASVMAPTDSNGRLKRLSERISSAVKSARERGVPDEAIAAAIGIANDQPSNVGQKDLERKIGIVKEYDAALRKRESILQRYLDLIAANASEMTGSAALSDDLAALDAEYAASTKELNRIVRKGIKEGIFDKSALRFEAKAPRAARTIEESIVKVKRERAVNRASADTTSSSTAVKPDHSLPVLTGPQQLAVSRIIRLQRILAKAAARQSKFTARFQRELQRLGVEYGSISHWDLRPDNPESKALLSKIAKAHSLASATPGNRFDEYYTAMLMYSPPTIAVNVTSNLIHSLARAVGVNLPRRVAGSILSRFGPESDYERLGEYAHMARYMTHAMWSGLQHLAFTWKHEVPSVATSIEQATGTRVDDRINKFMEQASGDIKAGGFLLPQSQASISGFKGRAVRFPHRINSAVDEWFKGFIGTMSAVNHAYRVAKELGLKGKDVSKHVDEQVGDYASDAWAKGFLEAQQATFTTKADDFSKLIIKGRTALNEKTLVGGTMIFPFVSIASNIFRETMAYFPPTSSIGILHKLGTRKAIESLRGVDIEKRSQYTGEEFRYDLARLAFGSFLFMLLVQWMGDDDESGLPKVTGTYSKNIGQLGIPDGSVLLPDWTQDLGLSPDTYLQLSRIEPFGTVMVMARDAMDAYKRGDDAKFAEAATAGLASFVKQMEDKTFLRSISDLMKAKEALTNDQSATYGQVVADWTTRTASNLVPRFLYKLREAGSDVSRSTGVRKVEDESLLLTGAKRAVQRMPFGPESKAVRMTVWGEPISTNPFSSPSASFVYKFIMPFRLTKLNENQKLDVMMQRWYTKHGADDSSLWISLPSWSFTHNRERHFWTDEEYASLVEKSGKRAASVLLRSGINWQDPKENDIKRAKKVLESFRDMEKNRLKRERGLR